jgi:hypothetical protein
MTRLVSKIYSLGPRPVDLDGAVARIWRLCRSMWVQQGTIVVKPEELPDELRRKMESWANDQYGERRRER